MEIKNRLLRKKLVNGYTNKNIKPIILHCVSDYPCSDNALNLYALDLLKEKFPQKIEKLTNWVAKEES